MKFIVLITLFSCFSFISTSISIGAVTWNLGRNPIADIRKSKGYNLIVAELAKKDIFALMTQETSGMSKEENTLFTSFPNHKEHQIWKCTPFMGCNAVTVYVDKTKLPDAEVTTSVLVKGTIKGEKSTIMVSVKVGDKVICFLGSHFETKYKDLEKNAKVKNGAHFEYLLSLYQEKFKSHFKACTHWMWGGDFNFRTTLHKDKVVHKDFDSDIFLSFKDLEIPNDDWFKLADDHTRFKTIQDVIKSNIARAKGDNALPFKGFTDYLKLIPSFSKSLGTDGAFAVIDKAGWTKPKSKSDEEKQPICFDTKIQRDGFNRYMCYAVDRSLSYTDHIFYSNSLDATNTRGYYGESVTDHHVVYSEFAVATSLLLENEKENENEKANDAANEVANEVANEGQDEAEEDAK